MFLVACSGTVRTPPAPTVVVVPTATAIANDLRGYLAVFSDGAMFVEWTESNGNLSGTLQSASYKSASRSEVGTTTAGFTGLRSGNRITLTLPAGFGFGTTISGTVDGAILTLVITNQQGVMSPYNLHTASLTEYNRAVASFKEEAARQSTQAQSAADPGSAQLIEPLKALCTGQSTGVVGAGTYTAGAGTHPVMVFRTLNATNYNRDTRVGTGDWSPKGLADAQLVACTDDSSVKVETCPYTSKTTGNTSTLIRYQNQVKIRLISAKDGKVVASETLKGTAPRECMDTETFTAGQTTMSVSGENVTPSEIQAWLKTYVAP